MSKPDNFDIAVYSKLNDLAGRYGVKPYEFSASLENKFDRNDTWSLTIDTGEALGKKPFTQMLKSAGFKGENELFGTCKDIYESLDTALQRAPRKPHR